MTGSNPTVDSKSVKRPLLSLFILSYITCVLLWLCPTSRWSDPLVNLFRPVFLYTGLWQGFAVFSPDPRFNNFHVEARVKLDNRSEKIWIYPRMEKMSVVEKFVRERYRKFGNDYVNSNDFDFLWPDVARFVARQCDSETAHPVFVTLERHWVDIPVPEKGIGKPLPEHTNKYEFFHYRILPEDLR